MVLMEMVGQKGNKPHVYFQDLFLCFCQPQDDVRRFHKAVPGDVEGLLPVLCRYVATGRVKMAGTGC